MTSHIPCARGGVVLVSLAVVAVLSGACLPPLGPGGRESSAIASLEAEYVNLYPRGASDIRCTVSEVDADAVDFRWSCTGGSLSGTGAVVTWEAPNSYGDYHIMVVATGPMGDSSRATLTLTVVPRPGLGSCCGR